MTKNGVKTDDLRRSLEGAAIAEKNVDREQIKEWLVRDIRAVYILLAEMLNTKEVTESLTDIFYNRYLKLKKEEDIKKALADQEAYEDQHRDTEVPHV